MRKDNLQPYAASSLSIQYRFTHKKTSPIQKKAMKAVNLPPYSLKFFLHLAGAAGFEPATYGFGDRRSTN